MKMPGAFSAIRQIFIRPSGKWRTNCFGRGRATRFVDIDRDTAMLLPPDLRDGVPANHLVHFLIDAVEKLDLRQIKVNTRGTGDFTPAPPQSR